MSSALLDSATAGLKVDELKDLCRANKLTLGGNKGKSDRACQLWLQPWRRERGHRLELSFKYKRWRRPSQSARTAACVAGNSRSFPYPAVHQSMKERILSPLQADSFVVLTTSWSLGWHGTCWSTGARFQEMNRLNADRMMLRQGLKYINPVASMLYANDSILKSAIPFFGRSFTSKQSHTYEAPQPNLGLKWMACLQMIVDAEVERGYAYPMVLRTRPDIIVSGPLVLPLHLPREGWAAFLWDFLVVLSRNEASLSFQQLSVSSSAAICSSLDRWHRAELCNPCMLRAAGIRLFELNLTAAAVRMCTPNTTSGCNGIYPLCSGTASKQTAVLPLSWQQPRAVQRQSMLCDCESVVGLHAACPRRTSVCRRMRATHGCPGVFGQESLGRRLLSTTSQAGSSRARSASSAVCVILVGGARTLRATFSSIVANVLQPLGTAHLYAALKLEATKPKTQKGFEFNYRNVSEVEVRTMLQLYRGFRALRIIQEPAQWERALLQRVVRRRFRGFLSNENNLGRAVAMMFNFADAARWLNLLERQHGKYSYVVAMRPDILFQGAFAHWTNQPSLKGFIVGKDWAFFMPRHLVHAALTNPYLAYVNQSVCDAPALATNEEVVKNCTYPHLQRCDAVAVPMRASVTHGCRPDQDPCCIRLVRETFTANLTFRRHTSTEARGCTRTNSSTCPRQSKELREPAQSIRPE